MPLDPSKSPLLQLDKNTYSKSSLSTWLYSFVYLPGSHLTGPNMDLVCFKLSESPGSMAMITGCPSQNLIWCFNLKRNQLVGG